MDDVSETPSHASPLISPVQSDQKSPGASDMQHVKKSDAFGDKIKDLERLFAGQTLDENTPFCVRIDGKSFHTYTAGLDRPYDIRLSNAMVETMNFLLEKANAQLGYTQSDEISLVFFKTAPHQQNLFKAKVQKLTSVLASMATARFNEIAKATIPERKNDYAFFDARVWSVPGLREAADVMVWRQEDAIKNAVSMAAQSVYPNHKHLHGKSSREKIQMMADKGIVWADFPEFFKSGTYAMKTHVRMDMSDELKSFANNEGKSSFLRTQTTNFYLPRLKHIENYENVLFDPVFEEHRMGVRERNSRKKMKR